jgi:hypothetical protein
VDCDTNKAEEEEEEAAAAPAVLVVVSLYSETTFYVRKLF